MSAPNLDEAAIEDLRAIRRLKRGHWDGLETLMRRGSVPRAVDTGPAQVLAPVGWLADNQTLLYAASMDGGKFGFKSHNLGTGETKDLFTVQNKSAFGALSPDGDGLSMPRANSAQKGMISSSLASTGPNAGASPEQTRLRQRRSGARMGDGWSSIHRLGTGSKSLSW